MNINELTNTQLDYWVARASGHAVKLDGDRASIERVRMGVLDGSAAPWFSAWGVFSPSTNWADAGPIIDRQRYTLYPLDRLDGEIGVPQRLWIAEAQMNPNFYDLYSDEQPLVAICRLRVAEAEAAGVINLDLSS